MPVLLLVVAFVVGCMTRILLYFKFDFIALIIKYYKDLIFNMALSVDASDTARLTTEKVKGMSRPSVVVVGCMVTLMVIGVVIIGVVLSLDDNDDDDDEVYTSLGDGLWSSYTIFNSLPHTA